MHQKVQMLLRPPLELSVDASHVCEQRNFIEPDAPVFRELATKMAIDPLRQESTCWLFPSVFVYRDVEVR